MSWDLADSGYDWARRFDEDAKARMLDDPVAVTRLDAHRDFANAVPTPTTSCPCCTWRPGQRGRGGRDILVDGYTYGSLSMTAYTIGMECPQADGAPSGEAVGTEKADADRPAGREQHLGAAQQLAQLELLDLRRRHRPAGHEADLAGHLLVPGRRPLYTMWMPRPCRWYASENNRSFLISGRLMWYGRGDGNTGDAGGEVRVDLPAPG